MDAQIISYSSQISWLPPGAALTKVLSPDLPPPELTTSIFAFVFQEDKLLMVRHKSRGWDLPGGHIEPGEDFCTALGRESLEEGAVTIGVMAPLGYCQIDLGRDIPDDYKYPRPRSFMAVFVAQVAEVENFAAEFETIERRFLSPTEVAEEPAMRVHLSFYEAALNWVRERMGEA